MNTAGDEQSRGLLLWLNGSVVWLSFTLSCLSEKREAFFDEVKYIFKVWNDLVSARNVELWRK